MNNLLVTGRDSGFVVSALAALHDSTNIEGELLDTPNEDTDAQVLLTINGLKLRYDCEIKKKVDRYAQPLNLLNTLGNAQRTLLISSPLSPDMALIFT